MSSESTAINELIDLARRGKPIDSSEDLLFEVPKAARLRATTRRPLFQAEPAEASSPLPALPATPPVMSTRSEAFEPTPRHDDSVKTAYVERHIPLGQALKKLAIPIAAMLVVGIAIGGIVRLARHHGTHVAAPVAASLPIAASQAPSMPIIASAPIVVPIAPAPNPKLVAVRLDSTPPGASATLVDNGTSTPLGSTPVDALVDRSKAYDIVFSLEGRTTKIAHLDPNTTKHIEIALAPHAGPVGSPAPTAPTAVVAQTPPARHHHHTAAKQAARVAAAPPRSPTPHASTAPVAKPPADGKGILMVSTTPPCAILIDGKNTGLTSPQAAIALAPGSHQVRLIAATEHINNLIAIEITPSHTTKLVRTFVK